MRGRVALVAAAAAVLTAACGGGDGGRERAEGPAADPVAPSGASSPFTVGDVPERFEVVTIGRGDLEGGSWGEDCCGTTEPYTVLSPDGTPAHPELVIVATTGYAGYQGGLEQASAAYTDEPEEVEVEGHEGLYAPPEDGDGWGDLVLALDDEVALRVAGPGATLEELVAVAEAAEVPDGEAAMTEGPSVPDPPDGLQLVGSASVEAVNGKHPSAQPNDITPPGPTSAHAVGWVEPVPTREETAAAGALHDSLAVLTLPGVAGDAAALAAPLGYVDHALESRTIDGRPAYVSTISDEYGSQRTVYLDSAWGDTVVVSASGEGEPPTADELVAIAASVRPTDTTIWQGAVEAGIAPAVADEPATDPVAPSEASSPFVVGEERSGWTLAGRGRADVAAVVSDECCGPVEPYTVLSPDGTGGHPDVVVVAAVALGEGGLEQAAAGGPDVVRPVEVGGAEGLYTPPGTAGRWPDLVVARSDGLAIRATSPAGDEQNLAAVVEATRTPGDPSHAPEVPEPPHGLVVVGHAGRDAVLSLAPEAFLEIPASGGTSSAHSASWTLGEGAEQTIQAVHTLPGVGADPEALAVRVGAADPAQTTLEAIRIDGRRAFVVGWTTSDGDVAIAVVLDSSWGDTVVVVGQSRTFVDDTDLIETAASVAPTDEATWQEAARRVAAGEGRPPG